MATRILALDVGDKTCGVAATDALGITAQPVTTLRYANPAERKKLFDALAAIALERATEVVVTGMPLNMNGSEGPQAVKVRQFIDAMRERWRKIGPDPDKIAWELWDERLSTSAAQRHLIAADVSRAKRKGVIDTMAAVFILQGYLDSVASY